MMTYRSAQTLSHPYPIPLNDMNKTLSDYGISHMVRHHRHVLIRQSRIRVVAGKQTTAQPNAK